MGLPIKLSHVPVRLAAGAFILNAGLGKRNLPEEAAAGLQSSAAVAFPQLSEMEPADFGKLLSRSEIALGAALLTPFVPSWLAGLGLAGFSGSLLQMYLKTDGLTEEDGIRPTSDGTPIAKDVWLLGIAVTLILDDLRRKKR
ncbi:hypothetical protein [Bogoriella caseilytica]|uniref:DoxX-like protein n=1 Tax=Bogoriella caseilytica TaxID=56055 RepID=A0A3N2BA73_9MICO|nr:hypothetical protein [Bogoriella caseilytica]ROR72088.1 hypothetical protein EDD31_0435 [Bogoriella caseilytica]